MQLRLGSEPLAVLGRARVYVCGITPYDTTHIGHAATFVWVDALARVLEHVGVRVQVCRNVTDVDDELLAEARRRSEPWQMLATQQTFQFVDDMRKLRVRPPAFEPRSQDYVTEVIFLARALIDRGAAYVHDGHVLFDGSPVAAAAGLEADAALRLRRERGGVTVDGARDPMDVPVWQPSAAGEPAWASPWGPGRPGWHAECAAMATAVCGLSVDVHAGGEDLAFPHHVYEAAMAEAATGVRPFARRWMHVGTVHRGGAKVAKSTGNLVFVRDLLERWPPEVLRLHLLHRRWSEPWEFDEGDLATTAALMEDLWSRAASPGGSPTATRAALDRLLDDLDVPAAVALEAGGETTRAVAHLLALM